MFQVQEGEGTVEELRCSDGVRAILECPVCLEVGFVMPCLSWGGFFMPHLLRNVLLSALSALR